MIVIINLSIPIFFLLYFLVAKNRLSERTFRALSLSISGLMLIFSLPMTFSDYEYSHWLPRFLTEPILLTGFALLLALLKRSKKLTIAFFVLAFTLNGALQSLAIFGSAFGNVDYPNKYNAIKGDWNYESLFVSTWVHQGFSGPPVRNYAVTRLKLNGLAYRKIARAINPDTINCIVKIRGLKSTGIYHLNVCARTLQLPDGMTLEEQNHPGKQ